MHLLPRAVSASSTMTNVFSTRSLAHPGLHYMISNMHAASTMQRKDFNAVLLTQKLLCLHHTGATVSELNDALLCDCLKHKPVEKEHRRDFGK